MRLGRPCVNFNSHVIGYGLGLGKSALAGDASIISARPADNRDDNAQQERRDRDIGVILRAGASKRAGRAGARDAAILRLPLARRPVFLRSVETVSNLVGEDDGTGSA